MNRSDKNLERFSGIEPNFINLNDPEEWKIGYYVCLKYHLKYHKS